MRRYMKNGFVICKVCGAVVVEELQELHANIHFPTQIFGQYRHFENTYEVDPAYDDETVLEKSK